MPLSSRVAGTLALGLALVTGLATSLASGPAAADGHRAEVGSAGPAVGITQGPLIANGSSQLTSRNWDGYLTYDAAGTTDFDSVVATWVQPTVTCEASGAWTIFWVGLDGWFDNTVEQGGSSAECGAVDAPPTYTLWWEMYPTVAVTTVLAIDAGDTIRASVGFATATSVFTITVKDLTTGHSFTRHEACAPGLVCSRSSADVVAEDVGHFGSGGFFPLADYGTVGFAHVSVTDVAGDPGPIGAASWENGAVTERSGGTTYASVSGLKSGGSAFSAVWHHP